MFASIVDNITNWIVGLFVSAVRGIGRPEDRLEVINWLADSRAVISSDAPMLSKFGDLYSKLDARRTVAIAFNGVGDAVKNYSTSDLPLGAKLAIPATLLAMPFAGGQQLACPCYSLSLSAPPGLRQLLRLVPRTKWLVSM
jgi:hypothetical protein